jgi:hypothetical protein
MSVAGSLLEGAAAAWFVFVSFIGLARRRNGQNTAAVDDDGEKTECLSIILGRNPPLVLYTDRRYHLNSNSPIPSQKV